MSLKQRAISGAKWSAISSIAVVTLQLIQVWFLSRLLTKDAFGVYAMVMVVVQIVRQFADMGIGSAIIQRQGSTSNELSSLYWLNVLFAFLFAGITVLSASLSAHFFREAQLIRLLWIAAASMAITGFGQQFQYLLQKELSFRSLAFIEIMATSFGVGVSIISAQLGCGVDSFFLGMLVNAGLRAPLLMLAGKRIHWPQLHFKWSELQGYLKFGVLLSGQNVINVLSSRLDSIIIGRTLGSAALGVYYFGQQFTSHLYLQILPIVSRVAFPTLSIVKDDEELLQHWFHRLTQVICLLVFPLLATMFVFVNDVLRLFFDERWWSASPVIRLLLFAVLIRTAITSVGVLLLAKARNDLGLYMNLGIFLCLGLFMFAGSAWGLKGIIGGLLSSLAIAFLGWILILKLIFHVSLLRFFKTLYLPFSASLMMGLVEWLFLRLADALDFSRHIALIPSIGAGIAVYFLFTFGSHAHLRKEMRVFLQPRLLL